MAASGYDSEVITVQPQLNSLGGSPESVASARPPMDQGFMTNQNTFPPILHPISVVTSHTLIPNTKPGIDSLVYLDGLFIKQEVEVAEILQGIETRNSYEVYDRRGNRIFTAAETTGCCAFECGGGHVRPFRINILDAYGLPAILLERPCSCCLCCSSLPLLCCIFGQIGGRLKVTGPNDEYMGVIDHKYGWYTPVYHVSEGSGIHVLTIKGQCCRDCYFCNKRKCNMNQNLYYPITNMKGENVGSIQKKYAGHAQESVSDADDFIVEFPRNMNVKWKVLLFAAAFLIDFMYFEDNASKKKPHDLHRRDY